MFFSLKAAAIKMATGLLQSRTKQQMSAYEKVQHANLRVI